MASSDTLSVKRSAEVPEYPRKRYRVSELPISSSQRSAIDGLVHTIKKKGVYDSARKEIWSKYNESVSQWLQHSLGY